MIFFDLRTASGAVLALAMAPAAQADVSAQDVWNDWKAYFSGVGYDVTAQEAQSGDTLSVSDITLTSPESAEAGSMVMQLEGVQFVGNDDGTVNVIFPDVIPMTLQTVDAEGTTADIGLELRNEGVTTVVSGAPTDMTSTYTAQSIEMLMTSLVVDGDTFEGDDAAMRFVMNGLSGTTQSTIGGKRVYDQRMQAADVDYDITFVDPEGAGTIDFSGEVAGLSFTGESALPLAVVSAGDMSALLSAGMTANGAFRYEDGASSMAVVENGADAFAAETTSNGGTLNVVMSEDGLTYSGDQDDLKVAMAGQDFPVPVEFGIENARFNLAMPLQESEEPEDFALGFAFNDFSMSDLIWGMFDPEAKLPRDPATLVLDLTGKARLLFDFLDPSATAMSAGPDFTPAEIDEVTINRFQIAAAGAELTGAGAFTFESETPETGLKPLGAADLTLVGGNKLLDTLVAIGLLPEDQAMGARMMMGLLAVPGDGPDTLNSKIEINEQGHVLANGQRIQ